jgi:hypothetical protein
MQSNSQRRLINFTTSLTSAHWLQVHLESGRFPTVGQVTSVLLHHDEELPRGPIVQLVRGEVHPCGHQNVCGGGSQMCPRAIQLVERTNCHFLGVPGWLSVPDKLAIAELINTCLSELEPCLDVYASTLAAPPAEETSRTQAAHVTVAAKSCTCSSGTDACSLGTGAPRCSEASCCACPLNRRTPSPALRQENEDAWLPGVRVAVSSVRMSPDQSLAVNARTSSCCVQPSAQPGMMPAHADASVQTTPGFVESSPDFEQTTLDVAERPARSHAILAITAAAPSECAGSTAPESPAAAETVVALGQLASEACAAGVPEHPQLESPRSQAALSFRIQLSQTSTDECMPLNLGLEGVTPPMVTHHPDLTSFRIVLDDDNGD